MLLSNSLSNNESASMTVLKSGLAVGLFHFEVFEL